MMRQKNWTLQLIPFTVKPGLLFLIAFFFHLHGQSQNIEFTRDNDEEFLGQLEFFTSGLERDEKLKAQELVDSLTVLWQSETLLEEQKEWIFNTLDQMQQLRLSPWPEQAGYIQGVLNVLDTREADTNFNIWHQSFQPLMNLQSQRKLLRYWETTNLLFTENILYQSNIVTWKIKNNDYILLLEEEVPKVEVRGSDLLCYAQDDSTLIYNTQGELDLVEEKFYGKGGKITWERVKLHPDTVFANLDIYKINMPTARWEADSVTFYNRFFFEEPLRGKLTERIIAEMTPETARYPRFESYRAVHEIKNLFQGIDFKGGFTMTGARVIGSGTEDGDATINIYRADSLFITARGRSFSILSDRIITQKTAVSIYLSGDSIFHPNINMRYLNPTREFSVLRDEKGFSKAPFSNSFHKMDMFCEAIYWNIDTYEIELRMIRSISDKGEANFESHDYFSDIKYMRMQGINQLHPLIRLRNFGREYGSNTFPINEFAKYLRADIASVTSQILTFSQDGFVTYHQEDETVTLASKLFHYITSYTGRSDFDVIRINSSAPVNAKLNMNNFDLHLYGVDRIPLSDEKNVVLYPNNQELVMKKNRDMYFDGRIESGLFDFYGKEFFFDYDNFKIELLQTDSMSFRVESFEPDSRGNHSLVRVKTVLEGINGELLVDHPRNKSGQMPYPRYPIFNSDNESYVYYDRDFVQEGVYKRENVFFKLIPFSIDSLDNATTDNIAFDGVFISTGIFPDFYDYLTVQPDYSLGFNTKTPEDGYTIYDGKAVYKGPIDMSYEGLRTDGELNYLNATIHANKMVMFPDSARADVNTFNLLAQEGPVEYPEVKARDVNMLYMPHENNMNLSHTTKPIEIFDGLAMLEGSIGLTPEGLTGAGELEFFGGKMLSEDFDFKQGEFDAEKTDLTIMTADGENTAIHALNYNSYVNIHERFAQLETTEDESKLEFELNRFNALEYNLDWDMNAGTVSMQSDLREEIAGLGTLSPEEWIQYDFSGNELISSHTAQDGLAFYAGEIDYNLAENVIDASEVKIIKVADAAIYPHNEKVEILERAEFRKLEKATVIANTETQLHQFYNAGINITSRWNYGGSGMYDYLDVEGNKQTVYFESISVDKDNRTTIAKAGIEKEQDFTISPRFGFHGEMDMKAENPNFFYKGATTLFMDCPMYQPNWFKFESEIQKDSIFIPLEEELKNDAGGSIYTAMMLSGDSVHVYPAVFDRQKHYSDLPLLTATGYLTYDKDMRQYMVSTPEKLANASLPDNIITINPNTCKINGHGDILLSNDLGQFNVTTYGGITHNLNTDEVDLDLVMGVSFFFLDPALGMVEEYLNESEHTEPLNINRYKYSSYVEKVTDEETSRELLEEFLAGEGIRRIPPELNHTFFFADLKMKWDQKAQTFHSTEPIGIGNIERFPTNLYVDGFLELKKARGGDVFNMILVPGGFADEGIGKDWFFFTYSQNIMQTIGSDNDYNTMIRNVKPRNRRMDVERGEEPFAFMLSSDRRPFDFLRSMRMIEQE